MDWKSTLRGFQTFLQLEKSLSENSVIAYMQDMDKLVNFFKDTEVKTPSALTTQDLDFFFKSLYEIGIQASSQARLLSSIKQFYKYCFIENIVTSDPTQLYSAPKISRKLPEVLSVIEIEQIISSIDHSTDLGMRNRAIIETLYGCGLRVSELCQLKISNIFWEEDIVKISGKGEKERLVPLGSEAKKHIQLYLKHSRSVMKQKEKYKDFLFLNNRGGALNRVMIFIMIKLLGKSAGIKKNISPHTFRHSFASHLVENGADIRIVQQLLGHENVITTEIYTHTQMGHLRNVLKKYHPEFKN